VRFFFANKKLELLYTAGMGAAKYPPEVVDAFFDKMVVIRAARDENDLCAQKPPLREAAGRAWPPWRALAPPEPAISPDPPLETDEQGKLVCIISIEDYH